MNGGRTFLFVSRTFSFGIFERDAGTFIPRVGLRRFIEVKHIALVGDQKTEAFQLAELVIISRARHPDLLLNGSRGQRIFVVILIGRKIDV